MYKVTFTSVKTIKRLEFHRYDPDMYDYIDEAYIQTGKLLAMKFSLSDDKMTEYCEMMFEDKKAWFDFMADKIIAYQEPIRVRYNAFNNIAVSINTEEILVTKDLYNLYLR